MPRARHSSRMRLLSSLNILALGANGYVRQRRIGEGVHRKYCMVIRQQYSLEVCGRSCPASHWHTQYVLDARRTYALIEVPISLTRLTVLKVVGSDPHAHAPALPRARDCSAVLGETVRRAAMPQVRRGLLGWLGAWRRASWQVGRRR